MNIALWAVAGILAAAFLVAGLTKLTQPREALAQKGMAYVEDFSPATIKTIGALEVAAAIGLILPPLSGVAPFLAPLAAAGLVVVMIGAVATHVRRNEYAMLAAPIGLLLAAAFVAWGRFGPFTF